MAGSLNRVTLIGNVVADTEQRFTPSGTMVVNLRLATNEYRRDANGERVEEPSFHRIVFFDKNAETASQYVTKGMSLYVEGRLKYGKYTNQEGQERYTTDIIASSFQMLSPKRSNEQSNERVGEQLAGVGATAAAADDMDDIPF